MASNLAGYIEVIRSNASRFPNTALCDMAIYTECNTQAIHFGVTQNSNSTLEVLDRSIQTFATVIATGSNANALSNIRDASSNWMSLSTTGTFSTCNISPNGNSNGAIFMGSNGYFTFSNNGLVAASNMAHSNIFSTDFTIESWVNYYTNPQAAALSFIGYLGGHMNPTANFNYWSFGVNCNMAVNFHVYNAGTSTSIGAFTQSNAVPLGRWTHIGMSYSNNEKAIRLFINGVVQSNLLSNNALISISGDAATSASNAGFTNNATLGYFTIGRVNNNNNPCWLHDFKFVTGLAYTPSNPPLAPLPLTTGTRLLLRAPRISSLTQPMDASSNWFTLSNATSVGYSTLSLSGTSNGSIDLGGGHITFPDNGVSANSNLAHSNILSTDFTIESWVYYYATPPNPTGVSYMGYLLGAQGVVNSTNLWSFGVTPSRQLSFYTYAGNTTSSGAYTTNTIALNTWNHIAVSHSNGEKAMRFYINGALQSNLNVVSPWTVSGATASFASSSGITNTGPNINFVVLGKYNNSNNPCYIHDFKFVTGTMYAPSNPPTSPATLTNGTRLLLRMANITSGVSAVDVSSNWVPLSNVGAVTFCNISPISTSNSIDLGANYFAFSNNGNAYPSSNIGHSNILATDFMIESWVNYYATPSNPTHTYIPYLVGNMLTINTINYWSFGVTTNRELAFYSYTGGSIRTPANSVPLNTWTHIALSYSNNEKRMVIYLNGVAQNNLSLSNAAGYWAVPSSSTAYASNVGQTHMNIGSGLVHLGRYNGSNNPCYIHDFKFVMGTTYAPSNPPDTIASVTPGTRLLLRATNIPVPQGNTVVTNPLYISTNGNVGINTNSPQFSLDVAGNTNVSGNLFTPGQPYYCAQLSNVGTNTKNAVISFSSNVQTNVGSAYVTNAFVAPVSGVYLISVVGVLGAGSAQVGNQTGEVVIRRNGVNITYGHWNCNDTWENASAQYAIQLNRNDVIDTFVSNSSSVYTSAGDVNGGYGSFSVIMIG